MLRSIPRTWVVLAVVLAVVAGGSFFALKFRDKKEAPPIVTASGKIGVINVEKAIESHPKYPKWVLLKQEETALLRNLDHVLEKGAGTHSQDSIMENSATSVFEQEFNAKMKAKQDELQEKMLAKMQVIRKPFDSQFEAYLQEIEKEYQPRIFDLHLKLSVLQLDEAQAKDIGEKIEKLKQEQNAKLKAKNEELSQKIDEIMAPEIKNFNDEMNRYASSLKAELSAKTGADKKDLLPQNIRGQNSEMPRGFNSLEEKVAAKKEEADALYESIEQDVRYKIIEVAVKEGLEVAVGGYKANISAFDITDLVIAEFKK